MLRCPGRRPVIHLVLHGKAGQYELARRDAGAQDGGQAYGVVARIAPAQVVPATVTALAPPVLLYGHRLL